MFPISKSLRATKYTLFFSSIRPVANCQIKSGSCFKEEGNPAQLKPVQLDPTYLQK
jgi:hypothetical protein